MQQIILQVSCASRRRLAQDLEEAGLTVPQFTALRVLSNHPEDLSMTELAEASLQVAATMTGIVDRLADRKLVERRQNPHDRRATRVRLTDQGRAVVAQIEYHQADRLSRIFQRFNPQERQELIRMMSTYLEIILEGSSPAQDQTAEQPSRIRAQIEQTS